jgi:hypothetical protein
MFFTSKDKELLAFTSGNGPLYFSNFNPDLVLVMLYLVVGFFILVTLLSSVFRGFLFLLLGPRFAKTFINLLESQSLILPSCITDARCVIDCSIQFLSRDGHPGAKSYIFSKNVELDFRFSFHSPVWAPKMFTLKSIRTEKETSREYKSPCFFIKVVLLFRFSWDFYIFKMWDLTEVHHSNSKKHKYCKKIKIKMFYF